MSYPFVPPGNNCFGRSSSRGAQTCCGRQRALHNKPPQVAATAAPASVDPSQPRKAEPRGDKWSRSNRECAPWRSPVHAPRSGREKRKEEKKSIGVKKGCIWLCAVPAVLPLHSAWPTRALHPPPSPNVPLSNPRVPSLRGSLSNTAGVHRGGKRRRAQLEFFETSVSRLTFK